MNHRHSGLFYAVLVLLILTLAGFKFPDILKDPQKEETAENDKRYEMSSTIVDDTDLYIRMQIASILFRIDK